MGRSWRIALALGTLLVIAAIASSALGWLGQAVVCGADHTVGCATWPTPASALVWLAFLAGIAALLIWQTRP